MNDYGNNIILASQAGCDLVLITEEGGDFPVGSNVFYYDDTDGVRQGFDITNTKNGSNVFENNQNIPVDFEIDLPLLEKSGSMFAGSNIKSFYCNTVNAPFFWSVGNMFKDCNQLKKIERLYLRCGYPGGSEPFSINSGSICKGCNNLEYVDIGYSCPGSIFTLMNAFEGCISLIDLNLHIAPKSMQCIIKATDMFKGCKLNSRLLQQLLDSLPTSRSTVDITIGYDPVSVDPIVDKPEGSESTWAEAFAAKKWTVTWEAYVEPVANAPKLLKAAKQKLYKLDEIDEELLDMLGDSTVYVKGGKHYLMTSGDSVTAPGTDGALLRDTDVENVVRAGSLQEAIDLLGVTEK